jgi:hypothetical protein
MPAGYCIGNHRLFVIDFVSSNIIGTTPPKVVQASSRRLNAKIPQVAAKYARILEEKNIQHRLIERIGEAHTKSKSKRSITCRLNRLDRELGHYMQHAEKKYLKIKSGRIPFYPESFLWIRGTRVYRSLLKYHAGRIWNHANHSRLA